MEEKTIHKENRLSDRSEAHYLDTILLDSIPHPALLVRKSREVIAANRLKAVGRYILGHLLGTYKRSRRVFALCN